MIDLDLTLANMLDGIEWRAQGRHLSLSDITDERVHGSPQCRLSFQWRPSEPDVVLRLFCLYLKTFPHASFDSIYHDLSRPVKHGTGNAVKRGNGNDRQKPVQFDHYFTEHGVVVSITDQGEGFDFRHTCSLFEKKAQYFTYGGKGFKWFAKCESKISYDNGGRTLLVQYRVDPAFPASSRECFASAGDRPAPFEIIETLPNASLTGLYKMARCAPELLYAVWKSPAFLETYILPVIPDQRQQAQAALTDSAELVDVNNRGAMVRYHTPDDVIVAKFFRRGEEGERTYGILRAAWNGELGAGQPYQVPKPLAYYPSRRLLVTTANDGLALDTILAGSDDELILACQKAARWLRKFHAIPIETFARGDYHPDGKGNARGAKGAPKDRKRKSNRQEPYAGLSQELCAEYEQWADAKRQLGQTIVPIHGRFAPENVLLSNGTTAATDFDSTKFGERGSDLSRFVLQLWEQIFRDTGQWQRAEMATEAFLTEYGTANPEDLDGLPYFWGKRILRSFEYHAEHPRHRGLTSSRDQVVRFHEAQLEFARRYVVDRGPPAATAGPVQ